MLKSNLTPAMQGAVANEVNTRLQGAIDQLQNKYESGNVSTDTSVDGPTGQAYKDVETKERERKKAAKAAEQERSAAEEDSKLRATEQARDEDDDLDGEEDKELRILRDKRLKQLKEQEIEKLSNIGKGHGQYREIVQDEFLKEVTSSERVICHFYHNEFSRCAIMDHHIQKLVQRHIETKFVKINSEKSPFFVEKLKIRSMPTLVYFVDGLAIGKLIGFDGLCDDMPEGKEDEWPTIKLARELGDKGMISKELIVDDDGVEAAMKARMESVRKQSYLKAMQNINNDDDEFDFDT